MRRRAIAALVAALAAAAVLGVLAAAVFAVGRDLDGADGRSTARGGAANHVAVDLVGARDALSFGHALDLLRTDDRRGGLVGAQTRRREVERILDRLQGTGSAHDRAWAANLLGYLQLADAAASGKGATSMLKAAEASFARAAALDGGNEDAKYNLELLLALGSQQKKSGAAAHAGKKHSPKRQGGSGERGTGY
jgi:hypothetical protein